MCLHGADAWNFLCGEDTGDVKTLGTEVPDPSMGTEVPVPSVPHGKEIDFSHV